MSPNPTRQRRYASDQYSLKWSHLGIHVVTPKGLILTTEYNTVRALSWMMIAAAARL